VKHFHVYDTTGEVMCVDAHHWGFGGYLGNTTLQFYMADENEDGPTFNWSNVVCVREEEDDDEGETAGIPPVFSGALN
jgi:hypothetical protein